MSVAERTCHKNVKKYVFMIKYMDTHTKLLIVYVRGIISWYSAIYMHFVCASNMIAIITILIISYNHCKCLVIYDSEVFCYS